MRKLLTRRTQPRDTWAPMQAFVLAAVTGGFAFLTARYSIWGALLAVVIGVAAWALRVLAPRRGL